MTSIDHEPVADVPPYVPARMVNEFVYCPRFFHLAWSSGEAGENDFTAEGKWEHRRVDVPHGKVSPDVGDRAATSVVVSSVKLGVIANIDVVESRDGTVIPIELKRGLPKEGEFPVWEPERVQIAVAVLILREMGYDVPYAEVRFTDSPVRTRVEIADELVTKTLQVLTDLRAVAADPVPPAPLVDSPKCPACVMNAACLPDEHFVVQTKVSTPVRRLVPHESAASPLYVTEAGDRIGIDAQELVVKRGREVVARLRLIDVSQLVVMGNVQVSTQALRELFFRDIPVMFFSTNGWFQGCARGLSDRNVELRRQQTMRTESQNLEVARQMVCGKILNSRVLLRRNAKTKGGEVGDAVSELRRLARHAYQASSFQTLLGLEGGAARVYFSRFNRMLSGEQAERFRFDRRSRRPPVDPVNCVLSYLYSLLVKDCTATLMAIGFDPFQGVYHKPRFGRPALALDLAEEFRPLIADSTAITLINNGEVRSSSFVERAGGVGLTPAGRRTVIGAYERRLSTEITHPTFKYKVTYRRTIEVQARLLAATLMGEFAEYRPMVTR